MSENDVDDLMERLAEVYDKDPTIYTRDDIDIIIAYQRKMRANREGGIKTKKPKAPGQKIDLLALGLVKAPAQIARRKL